MSSPRPALLCILDGWGWRTDKTDNAIAAAQTPNYTRMLAGLSRMPCCRLRAARWVCRKARWAIPKSGHMNIGAGRVVAQDLPRIDVAIEDGSLGDAPGAARSDRQGQGRQGRACI